MDRYHYDSLASFSKPTIRILTLSAGTGDDPLHGTLETSLLDEALPYEALSYVWGPPNLDAAIDCSRGSLPITKTLECALRMLRHQDKTRRLWIDQICINQGDDGDSERSRQIRLMRQIYSCAERTIVWLGNDEQEQGPLVRDLFGAFQAMGISCRSHESIVATRLEDISLAELADFTGTESFFKDEDRKMTIGRGSTWGWFPTDDILRQAGLPDRCSQKWHAFDALLQSPYFTRVWTVQEVLGGREAVVVWGTTELPWANLREAYRWAILNHCHLKDPHLDGRSPALSVNNFLGLELKWFRGMRYHTLAKLVMRTCYNFEASKPKDHIYAFVSLAPDGQDFDVNYSKTDAEVCKDFARHILKSRDLTLLNLAGLRQVQPRDGCLPSWVPSWYSRLSIHREYIQGLESLRPDIPEKPMVPLAGEFMAGSVGDELSASGDSTADLKESNEQDQLIVKGLQLDHVKIVCTEQVCTGNPDTSLCVSIVTQYKQLSAASATPPALLRAMICCVTAATTPASSFDHDKLLAQFISFMFNHFLRALHAAGKFEAEELQFLELIRLASRAMEHGVPTSSTFSGLTTPSQDWIKSLIREHAGQLVQEEIIQAISSYWNRKDARSFEFSYNLTGTGRKLFLTTQGHVGIGPARMTTTDVIIIAFGGKTPYVLRPVPGTQDYTLLGDCYIYGYMHGEAMCGKDQANQTGAEWFCLV